MKKMGGLLLTGDAIGIAAGPLALSEIKPDPLAHWSGAGHGSGWQEIDGVGDLDLRHLEIAEGEFLDA